MKKKFKSCFIMLLLFVLCDSVIAQTTYYVSTSGDDANNGTSWATAFRNLTTALVAGRNSSSASVIINVGSGTYKPTEGVPNSTDRDATFESFRADRAFSSTGKFLKIYGGFDASTGMRTIGNNTILSGDIGVEGDNTDNAFHVASVVGLGGDADSVVGMVLAYGMEMPMVTISMQLSSMQLHEEMEEEAFTLELTLPTKLPFATASLVQI